MSKPTIIGLLIGLAVIALIAYSAAFTVRQTQQALILQFGNPVRVEQTPGLKFKVPFIQTVELFSNQILDLDPPPQEVLLADQKRINVDAFARYRILDPLKFRQRANTEENFRQIFGAQLNSGVRTEVARIGLGDLLSIERSGVMGRITSSLQDQAPGFGVELIDVRIGRTDLPEATSQSVYNRMRSARIAQAAQLRAEGEQQKATIQAEADRERTVIIADATRQSQILRGQGEAEKTRTLNEAYGRDPRFFDFFRSLEAYGSLANQGTTMVLQPDADFFRFFLDESGREMSRPAQASR
jgi:membrane protease subunit HflC